MKITHKDTTHNRRGEMERWNACCYEAEAYIICVNTFVTGSISFCAFAWERKSFFSRARAFEDNRHSTGFFLFSFLKSFIFPAICWIVFYAFFMLRICSVVFFALQLNLLWIFGEICTRSTTKCMTKGNSGRVNEQKWNENFFFYFAKWASERDKQEKKSKLDWNEEGNWFRYFFRYLSSLAWASFHSPLLQLVWRCCSLPSAVNSYDWVVDVFYATAAA